MSLWIVLYRRVSGRNTVRWIRFTETFSTRQAARDIVAELSAVDGECASRKRIVQLREVQQAGAR